MLVYGCGSTPVGDKDSGTSIPARSTGTRSPEEQARVTSQMEAQIGADAERYAKGRPRKQFLGARVPEPRFAAYLKEWVARIEQIGNVNYPAEARGRIYGKVRLTAYIRADGSIENVQIEKSSGSVVLDLAALRIVQVASPFAPFPPEISRDTDILVITRTWTFARGTDSNDGLGQQFLETQGDAVKEPPRGP